MFWSFCGRFRNLTWAHLHSASTLRTHLLRGTLGLPGINVAVIDAAWPSSRSITPRTCQPRANHAMPGQHMLAQASPASLSAYFEPLQSMRAFAAAVLLGVAAPAIDRAAGKLSCRLGQNGTLKGWSERHVQRRYSGTHPVRRGNI